ncbi:uncharacterized protein B0T23DRAFT_388439 [Neurospora hispaniola]|uniref:Uncharacterized protein n=1 Tax=Neurospora hispaniola TaxID=588809 RepID=A0AAJ0I0U8_9PEZI|nr:hypothetical protein B0T23DRAFT_388439 [Neurospora hispaniola]
MSTIPQDIPSPDTNSVGTVRLVFSMEKPEQPAGTYPNQNMTTKRTKRLWTMWNRVLGRKPPKQQDRPSTPDTGILVIRYPIQGTRRIHMRYMEGQIEVMSGQSDKLKKVYIAEHRDSKRDQIAVKLNGVPIRSVHNLVDGFRVTTTKPEDAETLRKFIGCGVVLDCVLECIPPVMPKEANPVLSGTRSFIPNPMQSQGTTPEYTRSWWRRWKSWWRLWWTRKRIQ